MQNLGYQHQSLIAKKVKQRQAAKPLSFGESIEPECPKIPLLLYLTSGHSFLFGKIPPHTHLITYIPLNSSPNNQKVES